MQYLAQMTLLPKHITQKLIDIQEKTLLEEWKTKKSSIQPELQTIRMGA